MHNAFDAKLVTMQIKKKMAIKRLFNLNAAYVK